MLKKLFRPMWRQFYKVYEKKRVQLSTFDVPFNKLLRGGENGIRAARYAEITNNFLRPSTCVSVGPHVKFLQLYNQIGKTIWEKDVFENTDYFKNAYECMQLTGSYFYDRPEKIKTLAERFIAQHEGKSLNLPQQPGQSSSNSPIWIRPIKHSSYFEVIDGNHRIARAFMKGDLSIPAFVYDKEAVLTPLQQLLLDCLWINKQKWLYQPIDSPELNDEWQLIRQCTDRFQMMQGFLEKNQITSPSFQNNHLSYLDVGSSYGWFVKEMSKLGFNAFGMERDPFGMEVGFQVYHVKKEQIIHSDVVLGMENLIKNNTHFDLVSCFSVLHHFVLNKSSTSSIQFIKLLDQITDKVLFLDTGESHETAFNGTLGEWTPEFIKKWIKEHTNFKEIIPLGIDNDRQGIFKGYYNRTLFACVK